MVGCVLSAPQYLRGHDEAGGLRAQLNIPRQQTHVTERGLEVPKLLIGQSLDGGGVDGPIRVQTVRRVRVKSRPVIADNKVQCWEYRD